MQKILGKKAKVGKWFIIVSIASLIIAFYIKDYLLAFGIFFCYALLKIIINFIKPQRKEFDDYA